MSDRAFFFSMNVLTCIIVLVDSWNGWKDIEI